MGSTAVAITAFYCTAVAAGLVAVAAVWWSTRAPGRIDVARVVEREKGWFAIVVALLLGLLLGTVFFIPYGRTSTGAQVVKVTGQQFAWIIQPATITANKPVEFRLTSKDVNHAFAVYDDRDVLLFQVQVMPGKEQRYVTTFRRPGVYHVLCLEYCGLDHHAMAADFRVTR